MTGSQAGVGQLLRGLMAIMAFIVCINCLAHRLALASADGIDTHGYQETQEKVVNAISAYFNRSSQRLDHMKEIVHELGMKTTRIVKSGKTRWLSRSQAVTSVFVSFYALVQNLMFSRDESDLTASVLMDVVTQFGFIAVIAFMKDILFQLFKLSKVFSK